MPQPTWLGEYVGYQDGTGPRCTLRRLEDGEVVEECGGNAVSPLYEPQARDLIQRAVAAGYHVEAEASDSNGVKVTRYEPE